MATDILREIAQQIRIVDNNIKEAKSLIEAMKEVGLDVSAQEVNLRNLEKQKTKWEVMLKNRGISIG